jgi:hypothetical protein
LTLELYRPFFFPDGVEKLPEHSVHPRLVVAGVRLPNCEGSVALLLAGHKKNHTSAKPTANASTAWP